MAPGRQKARGEDGLTPRPGVRGARSADRPMTCRSRARHGSAPFDRPRWRAQQRNCQAHDSDPAGSGFDCDSGSRDLVDGRDFNIGMQPKMSTSGRFRERIVGPFLSPGFACGSMTAHLGRPSRMRRSPPQRTLANVLDSDPSTAAWTARHRDEAAVTRLLRRHLPRSIGERARVADTRDGVLDSRSPAVRSRRRCGSGYPICSALARDGWAFAEVRVRVASPRVGADRRPSAGTAMGQPCRGAAVRSRGPVAGRAPQGRVAPLVATCPRPLAQGAITSAFFTGVCTNFQRHPAMH